MLAELKLLEFDKILYELRKHAVTDLCKEQVLQLEPTSKKEEVIRMLEETEEAKILILRYDTTPMNGVLNVSEALHRARIGSVLTIEEILRVLSLIDASSKTIAYVKKVVSLELPLSYLKPYYDQIKTFPSLKRDIDDKIDEKGQIYDDASLALSSIRKKIKILESRIEEKMASLLRSEAAKLTDSLITIRNNRLVLPVKSDFKNQVKGIIHDQSSSKETVFIEPMACVEMNQTLSGHRLDEQNAIEDILRELTAKIGQFSEDLRLNFDIFTTLDLIFAKAKYALANRHEMPTICDDTIHLIQARHPLIPADKVVANTISFFNYKTIVITGPNTGGKTVALKTLGLLSVMLQSGMQIPVDKNSKTVCFNAILADIGDEQSIEQSLSTFSSHITRIISILKAVPHKSLLLLDELGSGTDPKEGASLAIAILDDIRHRNVYAMVTTHYPELKLYAYDLEDTINASVEFDIDSLKPTYRLQIGVPGTSNALDIASRLGMDSSIIEHAKNVSLRFETDTAVLIRKLENQAKQYADETEVLENKQRELEEDQKLLDTERISLKKEYNRKVSAFEQEKSNLLASSQKEVQDLINELNRMKSEGFKEHELAQKKHEFKQLSQKTSKLQKTNTRSISVLDKVKVLPYEQFGIVTKKRSEDEYEVQMGVLSAVFKETELEFAGQTEEVKPSVKVQVQKTSQGKMELDLRGMRFEEAMDTLDQYIDTCLINHLEFCYIIHGYGTLALRNGVLEYLKKNPQVKSFRSGVAGEGGSGVTVAYFK